MSDEIKAPADDASDLFFLGEHVGYTPAGIPIYRPIGPIEKPPAADPAAE